MLYTYRRPLRVVIAILLVVALAYGGIKAWMHYEVTRTLDDAAVAATGRAELGWGDIDTTLSGVVQVHDLTVLPKGAPQPVRIDLLRLSGPDLDFYLWGRRDDAAPPPHLRADLLGIHVELDPQLLAAIEAQGEAAPPADCAHGLDPALLRELGLERLSLDAALAYDLDAAARRLAGQLELEIHQIARLEASVTLADVVADELARGGVPATLPTLAGMRLRIHQEPAFAERYLGACAARLGQDVDTLRQALVNDTLAGLSRAGLQLGPGLRQAVWEYHRHGGDLRVSADPAQPINPMALLFAAPGALQQQLGLKVSVNGTPVTDTRFELRAANADELALMLGETPPPRPSKPQTHYRYVYHERPVASLTRHIGDQVRLHLNDGQPTRAGVLVAVKGGEARVEQRLHGGKITAHVALRDIARLEVREVEQYQSR